MSVQRSKRLVDLPPFLFMETRRRVLEAQARGIDVISLGIGDPDGATPEHILEALTRAAAVPANQKYPPGASLGVLEFREAVSSWYDRRFGVTLDPASEVLSLIGSKEGNHHVSLALLDPGDRALVPNPGYPAYESNVILAGALSHRVPMLEENDFLIDFDAIAPAEAQASKLMWLSYPNNPTTAVASMDFFRKAVDFAHRYDVILVNDNPYSEISFDGERVDSILQVDGAKEVAVEFHSLSKTYNMAGWRIGMAVGNQDVVAAMAAVKENTDSGVFAAVQHAGVAALDGPQTLIAEHNARYQRRRDKAVACLRRIGCTVEPPKATLYVWAKLPAGVTSQAFAAQILERTGVVVIPGSGYGSCGEGFVRLSLAVPDERFSQALGRIDSMSDQP